MKRSYLCLVCTLLSCMQMFAQDIVETSYYSANPKLGGDVVINSSTKSVKDKVASVTFSLNANAAGNYHANFWLFPTEKPNGGFYNYAVKANGKLVGVIKPVVGGWQSISLGNRTTIALVRGNNTISIVGVVPDVPNVEHVRLSTSTVGARIETLNYNFFYNEIQDKANSFKRNSMASTISVSDSLATLSEMDVVKSFRSNASSITNDPPLYDFECFAGLTVNYTFYKVVYFTQGQRIFLATNGIDDFDHILELFSATAPETYSWASMSNSKCMASLNVSIPQSGMYYVRVRSYFNARSGFCNLNVNGENYYSKIPVYSLGVRCTQGTDQVYNTFTVASEGDPRLWVEEGTSIPGKISYFNDDYSSTGNFVWGANSRIKEKFVRPVNAILLSTYGAYKPTAKLDLYIKCKNSDVMPYFPNLKADDAIQSSPASSRYNCISWSGRITSYWEWPASSFSTYWTGDPLSSFDAFYNARGLTRVGADASNAVVALWATIDAYGNRDYTHGSVRKGDGNFHGYDWESKPGPLARTFHPRDALNGSSYGQIVEYYTTKPKSSQVSAAKVSTLEEEIADGTAQIEYVNFDEEEKLIISDATARISSSVMSQFVDRYKSWKRITENTIYSSFSQMAVCNEYYSILSYCKEHPELINVLYEYLNEGDWATIKLIEDLTMGDRKSQPHRDITKIQSVDAKVKVFRTPVSNCIAYVKTLLGRNVRKPKMSYKSATKPLTGISYSNSNNIDIIDSNGTLNIMFDLPEESNVSLETLDLAGTTISTAFKNKRMTAGKHSATLSLNNNHIVLVRLMVNGHLTVKKYIVK